MFTGLNNSSELRLIFVKLVWFYENCLFVTSLQSNANVTKIFTPTLKRFIFTAECEERTIFLVLILVYFKLSENELLFMNH